MNYYCIIFLFSAYVSAWGGAMDQQPQASSQSDCSTSSSSIATSSCTISPTKAIYQDIACMDSKMYRNLNLTNVTAMFQPGYWESEYANIQQFCSSKGNGTYCYHSQADNCTSCLDMAVVRCPEGVLSSCRSGFICVEKELSGRSCRRNGYQHQGGVQALDVLMNRELSYAQCLNMTDALALPVPLNLTTTTDSAGSSVTVGVQVFNRPFAMNTTATCTMTYLSSLPSYFPSLSQPTSVCFNSDLPYDKFIPSATCNGPYPPGPMTTVCPSSSESASSSSQSEASKALVTSELASSSECMPTSTSMNSATDTGCPITSTSSSESQCAVPTTSASPTCSSAQQDSGMTGEDDNDDDQDGSYANEPQDGSQGYGYGYR